MDIRLILTGPEPRDFLSTGLDFTFDRDNQRVPGTRNTCGALICEEEIDVSNSSASDKDLSDSTVIFSSILSMSVFKKRVPTISDTMNNKRGVLLGSLTSQSPTITRVSNGRKVDGLLQAGRAKLRVELVKREDCSAEFVCQVKGVDSRGREVVSTTNLLQQQSQDGHQVYDRNPMPAVSLQVLTLMQQLTQSINGLENRMEDKISSLGNNVKDEIASLKNNVKDEIASLENKMQDKMSSLENRMEDKISSLGVNVKYETSALENKVEDMQKDITTFEYRLINKLDLLQNKLEKKIESIRNSNNSSALIAMEGDLDVLKSYGQMILNETEAIRKVLTSDVPSRCVATQATDTPKLQPQLPQQPDSCLRDMGKDLNQSYPHYVTMTQFILQRQILCDTKTDGGGWIVIQQPYELRVEITSGGKDYFALYKTFKLEDETNK
ncbi:phenylalanyl-tRNA synthetase alpha subunit [Elysia marginata]|uniref:Phenylalanyl-tRNA synthetase alpha subunit n=1 Tax=Elysia marginata TaxID=1093978 RepID=A0AAV4J835_9GAST|nr:phenylalanyl-tRNA synthetase alpha subunit [Elysia marginata]